MSYFTTYIRSIDHAVYNLEITAEANYRRGDMSGWRQAVEGLLEASEELIDIFGRSSNYNPPLIPETPAEWTIAMDASINAYHVLKRQARRAKERVTQHFYNRLIKRLEKLEETLVLQARAMHAEFLAKWPRLWNEKKEARYRTWYARRLKL